MVSQKNSPESVEAIAHRLRLTRMSKGLNKANFARLIGLTPQAWNNVEGTETTPPQHRISIENALEVCRVTSVGLNWIFRGNYDDMPVNVAMRIRQIETEQERQRDVG